MATPIKAVRILLADDHTLVRAGVRSLVEKLPNVEVTGEVGDGRAALEFIRQHAPDIVLMDVAMTGLNGLEATARITKEYPATRVIILSMHANEEYVVHALRAGAAGYLLKNAAVAELGLAVQAVLEGKTYLSPAVAERIRDHDAAGRGSQSQLEHLTPRQREILQLIAEGKSTKEIAFLLGVSAKTIETHRALLMDRLSIRDVPGLVRFAIRVGLVYPES